MRVVARLRTTYRNRVIIAGIAVLTGMFMFAFGAFSTSPSQVGRAMFWTLSYLTLAFCLFEGLRKTADCLSEEKREGTLGLLFLTDLKGYDIVLGKLAGKSLNSLFGLLSVLPVLALSLLLGGTTEGEYWRMVLALLNVLFWSLSSGIFVSCWCRDERQAFSGTFLFIASWIALPLLTQVHALYPLSPACAVSAAGEQSYISAPGDYWWSLLFAQGMSWGMLIWASFLVPNCWREEKLPTTAATGWRRWLKERPQKAARRARMLSFNPAFWLAERRSSQRLVLLVLVGLAAILAVVMLLGHQWFTVGWYFKLCVVLNFAVKISLASQACHCFAEARRNNALEMLLVTPLRVEQIISGQILALQRIFLIPVISLLCLEIVGVLGSYLFDVATHPGQSDDGTEIVFSGVVIICYLGMFALDVFAVAWVGMWYGLSSKSEGQAVTKTILFVLVAPALCLVFLCFGIPFVIGIPIACAVTARGNLQREFRRIAGQQFTAPADTSWLPQFANPSSKTRGYEPGRFS